MSNHSGGYMLNDIIGILREAKVFNLIGEEKTRKMIIKIVKVAQEHDCNTGEILDGHTDEFNLCYCCLSSSSDLEDGLCLKCRS